MLNHVDKFYVGDENSYYDDDRDDHKNFCSLVAALQSHFLTFDNDISNDIDFQVLDDDLDDWELDDWLIMIDFSQSCCLAGTPSATGALRSLSTQNSLLSAPIVERYKCFVYDPC